MMLINKKKYFTGCEQSFTNMSTLYMHMKKVHRKDESESVTPAVTDQVISEEATGEINEEISGENIYLVRILF